MQNYVGEINNSNRREAFQQNLPVIRELQYGWAELAGDRMGMSGIQLKMKF